MAAAGTAVTVLAPNGRRQTVKVSSSTPLLQVLEDVCKRHGFNPDEYDLRFQRNVVDLSLQWRFASLPNNAKLEMVASSRQRTGLRESTIRIALQLEDGSRLQDSFSCGQTLWDLLLHFPQTRVPEPQLSESIPTCVYMRDEIAGEEALKRTTLKSLGLTGGNAIIRYVLKNSKSPEDSGTMEAVAMETAFVDIEVTEAVPTSSEDALITMEAAPVPAPADVTPPSCDREQPVPQVVRPKNRPTRDPQEQEGAERPGPSGDFHVQSNMTAPLSTSTSSSTAVEFVPFSGGGQRLGGHGIEGREALRSSSFGGPPDAKKPKPSHDRKSMEMGTRGRRGEEEEEEGQQQHKGAEQFLEPMDREPLVFHMDAGRCPSSADEDLPDEFFEVTVDDIRKRFAQLKSERKQLEEAPLMTKALRESQMREKMEHYPMVAVRIQFPDRHVLQGFFRPLETVGSLRQFVRNHLADPEMHFYLFITPPKVNLDDPNATLFQANLFPAAVVYFGSEIKTDHYLQSQLLQSCVLPMQADEVISSCMPRSPTPASVPPLSEEVFPPLAAQAVMAGPRDTPEDPENDSQAEMPVRSNPGKVPKWLKLPGKK